MLRRGVARNQPPSHYGPHQKPPPASATPPQSRAAAGREFPKATTFRQPPRHELKLRGLKATARMDPAFAPHTPSPRVLGLGSARLSPPSQPCSGCPPPPLQESCSPLPSRSGVQKTPGAGACPGRGHPAVEGPRAGAPPPCSQGQPRGRAGCGRGPCPRLGGAEHPLPALPPSSCGDFFIFLIFFFYFLFFFFPCLPAPAGVARPVPSRPARGMLNPAPRG